MLKHTSGPWRWESIPGRRGKRRRVLLGGGPGRPETKVLTQASDCVPAFAPDEAVVAAAPALLAALASIMEAWEANDSRGVGEEIERSRAALAQARGK